MGKFNASNIEKLTIDYYVIFDGQEPSEKSPGGAILNYRMIHNSEMFRGHLFDSDMKHIIPALNFILHLPRDLMDVMNISAKMAYYAYKNPLKFPHNIIIIPSYGAGLVNEIMDQNLSENAFLFYEDSCEKDIEVINRRKFIDVKPISELSCSDMERYWHVLGEKARLFQEECYPDCFEIFLDEKTTVLPALFIANHLGTTSKIFDINETGMELYKKMYSFLYSAYIHIQFLYELERHPEMDKPQCTLKLQKSTTLPVVVSMMGRPVYQKKISKETQVISQIERDVCRFMVVHRACAIGGVAIEIEDVPRELFMILEEMEAHCRGAINNKYIWAALTKLGKKLYEHIGAERAYGIMRASHMTAFTDFPIGLAILPGCSAPLCCYVPISYRPLTPLTRALQLESVKIPNYYICKKCKIVVAECLGADDPIRGVSKGGWDLLNKENTSNLTVIVEDVNSISALKNLLIKNPDTDILIISAHGAYAKQNNLAGLCIGKEIWFGEDDDIRMPPLVMLSACHANPRGTGSVNVSDLLLRAGAIAVIGSFIPVNVFRNTLLFSRFISYVQAALEGESKIKTVSDAWSWVVASNAVNEILESNATLKSWMMRKRQNGIAPIVEFMVSRSREGLHRHDIYLDTIKILREMLSEDGMGEYFDAALKAQSFFPEALFYQVLGSPENIYLYNELYDKNPEDI